MVQSASCQFLQIKSKLFQSYRLGVTSLFWFSTVSLLSCVNSTSKESFILPLCFHYRNISSTESFLTGLPFSSLYGFPSRLFLKLYFQNTNIGLFLSLSKTSYKLQMPAGEDTLMKSIITTFKGLVLW